MSVDQDRPTAAAHEKPANDGISAADYEQTVITWNDTATPLDTPHRTLPDFIEHQAAATPGGLAITATDADGAPVTLTYAQLNTRANQLAHHLIAHGAGPETIVAVCLPRSAQLITTLLAILKTGAAYLPLDPDYPLNRLEYILEDAQPAHIVTTTGTSLPHGATAHTSLDDGAAQTRLGTQPTTNPTDADRAAPLRPGHPAYVIYTSGSTGMPKGVLVAHDAIVNRLLWMQHQFAIGAGDRIMQKTPYGFDVSVWELFWPIMEGATTVVARPGGHRDPAYMADEIERTGTGIVHFVPSMLWEFLENLDRGRCPSLRHVVCSGEALPPHTLRLAHEVLPGCTVTNLYGPTEAAVDVTWWESPGATTEPTSVPIGRPVWNTQVYVLDHHLQPVAPGTPGELYLAGTQLARGYHNRPTLTAQRFTAHPYGPPGTRMYRTGDLVHWNTHGTLTYLGRTDDQVKLRGFRIEPAEIDTTLTTHPTIAHAITIVREDTPGDQRLVTYLVPTPNTTINTTHIHHHATQHLPHHMIPNHYITLTELPLTGNGKLNRKALPKPTNTTPTNPHGRPPRTPTEHTLCTLYTQTLNIPHTTIDDNFFTLGGHSLLATRLATHIRKTLNTTTTVQDIFTHPTPATLATTLTTPTHHRPTLTPRTRTETVPASYAQRGLWFLDQMTGPSATYNVPVAVRLTGALDLDAMQAAVDDVVARHEALRTVLHEADGDVVQVVQPATPGLVPLARETVRAGEFGAAARRASRHLFRLDTELPVKAWAFTAEGADREPEHLLVVLIHHVATDGWSRGPLLRDLARAYTARTRGEQPDWTPLPVQYADYTLWQRDLLGEAADPESLQGKQVAYWRDRLSDAPAELDLPYDRPRPDVASHRGAGVYFDVPAQLHERLLTLASDHGVTLFMVVHAALAVVLSRLGAGEDIVVGTPVAGRSDDELDNLVGYFVNVLPLRVDLSGDPTCHELLDRVQACDAEAFAHQEVPFERLVGELCPDRSTARHPLFQTSLVFETDGVGADSSATRAGLELPGLRSEVLPHDPADTACAKFDLTLSVTEGTAGDHTATGLAGLWTYAQDLFDETTIRSLTDRLVRVLDAMATNPAQRVGAVPILSATEFEQTVITWNDTATSYDDGLTTLPELVERQAHSTPHGTAVTCAVGGTETLSYDQLNTEANQLAHHLISAGAGPDTIVAVCLPRSTRLLVALLAVLKTGATYLPLDPDYPAHRLEYILEDAQPTKVVTTTGTALPGAVGTARIDLDDRTTSAHLGTRPTTNPADADRTAPLHPHHAAYIIYTSGSTGKPKGVLVPHSAIANYVRWAADRFQAQGGEALMVSSVAYDLVMTAIYPALTRGGSVRVVDVEEAREPAKLASRLTGDGAAHLVKATPSHLREMVRAVADAGLTWTAGNAAVGGELFHAADLDQLRAVMGPDARVVNHYGPTEATVGCIAFDTDGWDSSGAKSVPIGRPVWNTQVYVLDHHLQPVAPGTPGELYLAGTQLARGYHNRPTLTAQRFTAHPYGPPGTRMYRTGDLVHWNTHGTLTYLGRTDDQVKLRGFRIEPAEIDTTLTTHPTIAHAITIVREDTPGDQRLVTYLVPTPNTTINTTHIHHHATQHLPHHMIPNHYITLTELPLTGNGKLNRKALPKPTNTTPTNPHGRPPRTPTEHTLCTLYTQTLNIPHTTIDDNFFTLGGHSLLATRLATHIRKTLNTTTTVQDIFTHPTPATLATTLTTPTHHRPTLTPRTRRSDTV